VSTGKPMRIGVFVFDGCEELDVVGPYEVLAWWARNLRTDTEVVTFSADGAGVRCSKGLRLLPDAGADDVGPLHVVVYPGGRGTRTLMRDEAHLAWVRELRTRTPLLTSVCTGALVLAAAGLLAGRPATTHWGSFDLLTELDPSVQPDRVARFVDDGDVITSAGVSAGIDMALHLVARLDGVTAAREVRRGIQYDPHPPI